MASSSQQTTGQTKMKYSSKDQNYQDETTIYWFKDESNVFYGIADCNGKLTALDCDGMPIDYNNYLRDKVLSECVITEEMKAE